MTRVAALPTWPPDIFSAAAQMDPAAKFVLIWSGNSCSAGKVDQQFREYATLARLFGLWGEGTLSRVKLVATNHLPKKKTLFNLFVEYRSQNVDIEPCLEQ